MIICSDKITATKSKPGVYFLQREPFLNIAEKLYAKGMAKFKLSEAKAIGLGVMIYLEIGLLQHILHDADLGNDMEAVVSAECHCLDATGSQNI